MVRIAVKYPGINTLHYEVSATVYENGAPGHPVFSSVATVKINPASGELIEMSSKKTENPEAGPIKFSAHFGHTGREGLSDERTFGDKLAIYLRASATGQYVPETIVNKLSEKDFLARTIDVRPDARNIAQLKRELEEQLARGTDAETSNMIRYALGRLSSNEIIALSQAEAKAGALKSVLESTEFANSFAIAKARAVLGAGLLTDSKHAIVIDARRGEDGFTLSNMTGAIRALSGNIPIRIYVVVSQDEDRTDIKGVKYITNSKMNIREIISQVEAAQKGVEPSNIAIGVTDSQANIASLTKYFTNSNKQALTQVLENGQTKTQESKIPALTILNLLTKIATTGKKDELILTAVGYDNDQDAKIGMLKGFFHVIVIKAKDIAKEILVFMRSFTETGHSV